MNFYIVYLLIPTVLFIIRPLKNNKLLVFYWAAICILSYDNVTDYYFYYDEFFSLYAKDTTIYEQKGREWGWVNLFSLLTFTKYGIVLMHTIVLSLIVYQYHKYSKKLGILNISILLYFICNLVWKHDNIWRQDIAIFFAYIAFFKVIESENIDKKLLSQLLLLTVCAFLFHASAILLIPIYFFIRWIAKVQFRFIIIFPIVISVTFLFSTQGINSFLNLFTLFFSAYDSNTSAYYLNYLSSDIENSMTKFSLVWTALSTVPLFYYNYINKESYKNNKYLRLCVNLSWIVITWRTCFTQDLLKRPTDYLLWFQVWAYAFVLKDMFFEKKKQVSTILLGLLFFTAIYIQEFKFIQSYYGENNYLTIFSHECEQLRIYKRSFVLGEEKNFKRIR